LRAGFGSDGSARLGNGWSSVWLDEAGKILFEDIPILSGFTTTPDGQWTTQNFKLVNRDGSTLDADPSAVSPDGTLLVESGWNKPNRILEFPSLKPLLSFGHLGQCSIDRRNQWLCQSDDTTTRIYSLIPSKEPRDPPRWTGYFIKNGKPVPLSSGGFHR